MAYLAKKSSFGALRPINEQMVSSSQSRHFRNNFSDIASYIDKKDNSFDSGDDFVDQLKKLGFETVHIEESEDNSQKKMEDEGTQLNPVAFRLGKSTGVDENFLDFSNLMKMRHDQAKSIKTEKSFCNTEKLHEVRSKVRDISKKMKIERKQIEIALLEFQDYQAELVQKTYQQIANLLAQSAWDADNKIDKEKAKWQKQTKKLEEQNRQNRQKLYESNFQLKQHEQKIRTAERLLQQSQEEKSYYKQQAEDYKQKIKQLEKKKINQFSIPKTDIDYSFSQIQIQHLKTALADLQRENSCLKIALESKEQQNENSQNFDREMDKTRYLSMIQKFQEEIEILEHQINELRLQEKEKSERIRNWERDFEEQQQELQITIEQCQKKERYLKDLERKLKMREEALMMRQEILENSEMSLQRDRANHSPKKYYQYEPRTPRMRPQMSPNPSVAYYSPKIKSNLWLDPPERTPQHSNRTYLDKKYNDKDLRINSRIQKIQNSLNRELSNLSRRF